MLRAAPQEVDPTALVQFMATYNDLMWVLEDAQQRLLLRRSMLAMLGRVSGETIEELARALGKALGWDEERKAAEIARTLLILSERHGVQL